MNPKSPSKSLGIFSIILITTVSVDSIRNLPAAAAEYGVASIGYYLMAGILFLIPAALCAADLSARFDEPGGIYLWVKTALGKKIGFLAIWLQWAENVFWYPNVIILSITPLLYLIEPSLVDSKPFITLLSIIYFWFLTWINLRGLSITINISNFFTVIGLFIPMLLISLAGAYWLYMDYPWAVNSSSWLDTHHSLSYSFGALSTIMVSFLGVEIATIHSNEVQNPRQSMPKALMISCFIIFITQALGAFSVSIIVPEVTYSLGLLQMFDIFLHKISLHWLLPGVIILIVLGFFAAILNWIIAPTKGLLFALKDIGVGHRFWHENKQGAPVILLNGQALFVSLLSLLFLAFNTDQAIFILLSSTTSLYMVMYCLMFLSLYKLRNYKPERSILPRPSITLPLIVGVGFTVSLLLFCSIFFTGEHLSQDHYLIYSAALILFIFAIIVYPFYFLKDTK
ncbi:MAG TPA: APC family permease [Gammaproteobacteria bacterium]|nr:APC family permease [Gammaproteobacteria bacterium]